MRLVFAMLLTALAAAPAGAQNATALRMTVAQNDPVSPKDAFEAAKALGTIEAWQAYVANFPRGFYADLARAYIKSLSSAPASPPASAQSAERKPAAAAAAPAAPGHSRLALGPNASLGSARLLPDDSPCNRVTSKAPVDPNPRRIPARVGLVKPLRASVEI